MVDVDVALRVGGNAHVLAGVDARRVLEEVRHGFVRNGRHVGDGGLGLRRQPRAGRRQRDARSRARSSIVFSLSPPLGPGEFSRLARARRAMPLACVYANGRNVRAVLSESLRRLTRRRNVRANSFRRRRSRFPCVFALGGRYANRAAASRTDHRRCRVSLGFTAGLASAQSFQGGMRGAVKDAQGVIPGVTVTLINEANGVIARHGLERIGRVFVPGARSVELHHQGRGAGVQDLRAARHPHRHAAVRHARHHARSRHRGGVDHRHRRRAADRNVERLARRSARRQDARDAAEHRPATCS